ncbi:MAG: hypothetical protein KA473_10065 [Anaerolineales bacterium]|nr:hypothetical protein [Anaerolineales bacterium]
MLKKFVPISSLILLISSLFSLKWVPSVMPYLAGGLLALSLVTPVSVLFERQIKTEKNQTKFFGNVLKLICMVVLAIFLGGLVGLYINYYAAPRWGVVVGLSLALVASFLMGYSIKKGMWRVFK